MLRKPLSFGIALALWGTHAIAQSQTDAQPPRLPQPVRIPRHERNAVKSSPAGPPAATLLAPDWRTYFVKRPVTPVHKTHAPAWAPTNQPMPTLLLRDVRNFGTYRRPAGLRVYVNKPAPR
jgi:hypothetical protein